MTLIKKAKKGIITDEMKAVAKYEGVDPAIIRDGIANGTIIIPKNKLRSFKYIRGIGKGLRTKVNANIGSSPYHMDVDEEVEKLEVAVKYGADSIMDLSLGSKLIKIRREILKESGVMVGTVPIYQTAFELSARKRDITEMGIGDFLATVERQAKEGVDFMTIHSGVIMNALSAMENQKRVLDVVSRGGAFLIAWMRKNKRQSPLYEFYDDILDILASYDVTISLGDGLRPGAIADATDRAQITELVSLGELCQRAWDKGVQVMIEGPGHVPLNMVQENMELQKALTNNAPFYVLGPLVTDIASGYDHIAGAIGGALAAYYGADFLCYVTPSEHLKLPGVDDVMEGVIAFRIAAHAADLAKGMSYAVEMDKKMSKARKDLDWKQQIEMSINPGKAKEYRETSEIGTHKECTMCGDYCAIKKMKESDSK
ncbi:MAG: phosphomethylpyrimidine synthase ThiC [Thermodesulfobacteriota bacterium]|nr:phosphomethylpyrimidine synthase ThiC [Thermodesulfobacteriota bacterium]